MTELPAALPLLIELINQRHATTLALGERYALGEQGAFAVTDATGGRFVLKCGVNEDLMRRLEGAAIVADHMHALGYPVPRYHYVGQVAGMCYAIQSALPGAPMGAVRAEWLPELLRLNHLQAGQALSGPRDWPTPVVETVLVGGDGYCILETLRTHSPATRRLLDTLQALVVAVLGRGERFVTDDVVHFDFSPSNILVADGQVSGIIDWEGTCAGDCAFDLATLLFYSYHDPAVREPLRQHLLAQRGPGPLSIYLAQYDHPPGRMVDPLSRPRYD